MPGIGVMLCRICSRHHSMNRQISYWSFCSVRLHFQKDTSSLLIAGVHIFCTGTLPRWNIEHSFSDDLAWSLSKRLFYLQSVRQWLVGGLHGASYSTMWKHGQNSEQSDESLCTALKWLKFSQFIRVFECTYCVNRICWHFNAPAPMTYLRNLIRSV